MEDNVIQFLHNLDQKGLKYKQNEILAPFTTWKIGGPAEIFFECESKADLILVIKLARDYQIPVTILGSGSNILIADEGIKGLVIRNKFNALQIDERKIPSASSNENVHSVEPRLTQIETDKYYSFEELDYDESTDPLATVIVGSGYYLPLLINVLINKGITGLQWFSGIPGTIGGAVYNNIHGGAHFISEYVNSVTILTPSNQIKTISRIECQFDYDYSRFHNSGEIILEIELYLRKGDTKRAQNTAMNWAQKKKIQPYNSAGCCFRNLDAEQVTQLKLPTSSWGHIIDNILHLKNKRIGDALISPKHAAFIENIGHAKATDVLDLINLIYKESAAKIGVTPKLEIFFLGFSDKYKTQYSFL